jgi:hypothetical protein
MATQEMILKLSFDDEGTFTGLEDINQEIKKVDESTVHLEKSTKTLKAQYAELKKQQDQTELGTEKFNELSIKMGELKDRMNDAAEAVKGNTGPAIEGMSNTFGIMGEQLSNLDFEGLTQSIQTFSGNLARIDTAALGSGLKAAFQAGVAGLKALGKAVLANPIFLLVGVIVAVIAYWEELSDFVTGKSKMLENLKAQAEALKAQEQSLTRELALQKALGAGAAAILRLELDLLKNKQTQAEVAMKIAYTEKDRAAFLEAQQAQLQAINELELRKVKINQDAQALLDKIRAGTDEQYNKQLVQNQAFSEYKKATEELSVLQQINNDRARQINTEIAAARKAGNNALADQLVLERESLKLQNISLQNNKDEIWNAGEAAKDTVKTEKELEAIAKAKAAAAERKAKADAESKRIRDEAITVDKEIAAIEKALADSKKTEQKREIDDLLAAQKVREDKYKADKRNAEDMRALNIAHSIEMQLLLEKYKKINQDAADEQAAKDKDAADKRKEDKAKELQDLQAIIDAADKGNIMQQYTKQQQELIANDEYYQQLISQAEAAKISSEALVEEQARKENEIKEKYRKEDAEKRMANIQKGFEMADLALSALMDLNQAAAKGDEASQRKTFERNKLMMKAQATIAMAAGIVQQLGVPQDQLTGMNFVKAAAVAAAGIANIVKINQTQFSGGGSGGGNGNLNAPTGGGANAPAIDFSGANLQVNAPGSTETYVLAGNVANALEARQKIIDQSHL